MMLRPNQLQNLQIMKRTKTKRMMMIMKRTRKKIMMITKRLARKLNKQSLSLRVFQNKRQSKLKS